MSPHKVSCCLNFFCTPLDSPLLFNCRESNMYSYVGPKNITIFHTLFTKLNEIATKNTMSMFKVVMFIVKISGQFENILQITYLCKYVNRTGMNIEYNIIHVY